MLKHPSNQSMSSYVQRRLLTDGWDPVKSSYIWARTWLATSLGRTYTADFLKLQTVLHKFAEYASAQIPAVISQCFCAVNHISFIVVCFKSCCKATQKNIAIHSPNTVFCDHLVLLHRNIFITLTLKVYLNYECMHDADMCCTVWKWIYEY